ncbi:hypothetical protein FHS18_003466 [Paenibacillus phyllosphaerae]|uniref:Uncharacterized protein n=1 Tax=Paenibacillus phyllosphaerae TaxID=274593 RepID=A0A7W5AZ47_9BACL|nr:glycoside hydrolase family 43 protein [Paenibacillus phyllosphaerae]MBB3111398.1 hypothetical protein [Paenibacillus phyllosphaerae]
MKRQTTRWMLLGCGALALAAVIGGSAWALRPPNQVTNKVAVTMERTYQNPMTLAEEWEDYGIGDPYILRYNGKYYLYCSTKDWRVGVKAWSSDDLVDWTYEGLVTEEPLTEGAYAPEVVYWNGSFYMYTSPAGKGHYVLESDSPTGPFTIKTDNLGLTIDGSVFIDDDASWTFTHAESGGIMASSMTDPFTIETGQKLNTSLGHWTEGSMIIKRDGRYFLTYTGNHVFSKGYRVNYAVAHDSPVGLYTIPENNPIIISTADDFNGLGHSATVLGPDMDAYYIVYHNLIGHSAEGPPVRMFNMDRLTFNGDKMSVLGPTFGAPSEAPQLPAFRDPLGTTPGTEHWEQTDLGEGYTAWISKAAAGERFTAEFNAVPGLKASASEGESLEAIISYADPNNYRSVGIDTKAMALSLAETKGGETKIVHSAPLPEGADLDVLHALRVESDATGTRVYWDGLLRADYEAWAAQAGRIGYRYPDESSPQLHYTAFSNEAGGSSDRKAVKPLPGTMEAVHGIQEEAADITISADGTPDGSSAVRLAKGAELAFPMNVKQDGTYLVSVMAARSSAGARLQLSAGDRSVTSTLEESDFAPDADWSKIPLGELNLQQGTQWLTIRQAKGEPTLLYVETAEVTKVEEKTAVVFDDNSTFGDWIEEDGRYAVLADGKDSKQFGGDQRWSDIEVSFELTQTAESLGEASLLVRTTNESDFPDQVVDSFMGYELAFRNGRVMLRRISYEVNEELDSALLELTNGQAAKISVRLKGAAIQVFADGNEEPLLSHIDRNAFLHGRVGIRASQTGWSFSNVNVSPVR